MKEVTGIIDHRILLNYRIDPEVMQRNLPSGFRPKIVNGYAIGGICQVSLSAMRPKGFPAFTGSRSDNAAHRMAVVGSKGEGVYIPRRDTNSWVNALSGGRIFSGVHGKMDFKIKTVDGQYAVDITDNDKKSFVRLEATLTDILPKDSIFKDVKEVSDFFAGGNIGWSPKKSKDGFDTIELKTFDWKMEPLSVKKEFSAFFSDENKFPKGSVRFDCAMIMRNLKHSWISRDHLCDVCS